MTENVIKFPGDNKTHDSASSASGNDAKLNRRWQAIEKRLREKTPKRAKTSRIPKNDPDTVGDETRISRNLYDLIHDRKARYGFTLADLTSRVSSDESPSRALSKHRLPPNRTRDVTRSLDRRFAIVNALARLTHEQAEHLYVELFKGTWFGDGPLKPALYDREDASFDRLAEALRSEAESIGTQYNVHSLLRQAIKYQPMPDPRRGVEMDQATSLTHGWQVGGRAVGPGVAELTDHALTPRVTLFTLEGEGLDDINKPVHGGEVATLVDRVSLRELYQDYLTESEEERDGVRAIGPDIDFTTVLHNRSRGLSRDCADLRRIDVSRYIQVQLRLVPTDQNGSFACRICELPFVAFNGCSRLDDVEKGPLDDEDDDHWDDDDAHIEDDLADEQGIPVASAEDLRRDAHIPFFIDNIPVVPVGGDLFVARLLAPSELRIEDNVPAEVFSALHDPEAIRDWDQGLDIRECTGEAMARFLSRDLSFAAGSGALTILGEEPQGYFQVPAVAPTQFRPDSGAAYIQANHLYASPGHRWADLLIADIEQRQEALERYLTEIDRIGNE